MKRVLYITSIVLLAAITSCTNDRDAAAPISISEYVAQKPVPVSFDTYNADAPTTRAGAYGVISTNASLQAKGFGVFAYYTQETKFDNVPLVGVGSRNLLPDFMYNEYIVWDATNNKWDYYDPNDQKFWPNDFNGNGNPVDTHGATGTKLNYISFFAYAPYAGTFTQAADNTTKDGATPPTTNGDGVNSGIIAASGNAFNGDPFLTYRTSNDATKAVDLLWGTAGGTDNGDNVVGTAQPGGSVTRTVDDGTIYSPTYSLANTNIDMTKQETDGKVKFNFKHALAKVGGSTVGSVAAVKGLTVDLLLDSDGSSASAAKSANTKVTVKRITITHDDATTGTPAVLTNPMESTGVFNLATGEWTLTAVDNSDPTTYRTINYLIDQGGAGTQGNILAADIMEPTTAVTTWANLDGINGVVETTPKNVFATEAYPLVFLPGSSPRLKFTIEYCVRTKDDKLAKGFTEVWQTITKTLSFGATTLDLNKQYNIKMHLGLTTVKFDASVCDWDNGSTETVDLPINVM